MKEEGWGEIDSRITCLFQTSSPIATRASSPSWRSFADLDSMHRRTPQRRQLHQRSAADGVTQTVPCRALEPPPQRGPAIVDTCQVRSRSKVTAWRGFSRGTIPGNAPERPGARRTRTPTKNRPCISAPFLLAGRQPTKRQYARARVTVDRHDPPLDRIRSATFPPGSSKSMQHPRTSQADVPQRIAGW